MKRPRVNVHHAILGALVGVIVTSALLYPSYERAFRWYLKVDRLQAAMNPLQDAKKRIGLVLASLPYITYKTTLIDNTLKVGGKLGRDKKELLSTVNSDIKTLKRAKRDLLKAKSLGVKGLDPAVHDVDTATRYLEIIKRKVERNEVGSSNYPVKLTILYPALKHVDNAFNRVAAYVTKVMPKYKFYEISENVLYTPPLNFCFEILYGVGGKLVR
ncbi:MAG: hypothetical protein GXO28_06640 [Methanopyri archaeon]|nr:hypothetical protein [Methanopyri archaeon]